MEKLIRDLLKPIELTDEKSIYDPDGTLLRTTVTRKTVAPHSLTSIIKLVELLNREASMRSDEMEMSAFKDDVMEMLNENKRRTD